MRATASVAPAGVTGRRPALASAPQRPGAEVTAPATAAVSAGQARSVPSQVQAIRGVPYDARAVLGGPAAPPAVASAASSAPDFVTFPVPSRYEAVVGVPLETYPPVPVPRLHRGEP